MHAKRFSFGVDQRVWRQLTTSGSYSYTRGSALARGQNLNAPTHGSRPQPAFGNVVEVVSDASSRLHQLQVNARNGERAAGQWTVNTFFAYMIPLGKRSTGGPPITTVIAGGGVPTVQSFEQPPRYIFQFFVQAQNLTNHPNYTGYSGTLTSPFYRQPTAVSGMRKIDMGVNVSF